MKSEVQEVINDLEYKIDITVRKTSTRHSTVNRENQEYR